ncbi:MAG: ABC transporter ATP-binding protein [Saprospiraceae bacterium]
MKIILSDISKRFSTNWVLKKVNFEFLSGGVYGVKGANGSGKSTLMKIISSQLSATRGDVKYTNAQNEKVLKSRVADQISFAAPYIYPLENLSLREMFDFHYIFRNMREGIDYQLFIEYLEYPFKEDQLIKYYSSGMKQRISLAFSILTFSDLILLDEPTSYLDEKGKVWFHSLLKNYKQKSTVIISTNNKEDLLDCTEVLGLSH